MQPRAVHTRLAALAFVVIVVAALAGVLAFRRASADADSVAGTATLVAVGLDDQALIVDLQNERWQSVRDGDLEVAAATTDALIEVRDFDAETLDLIVAARSPQTPGGYGVVIDRLLDRSGHVDPDLLDGADAARAAVNADLLHWRQALIDELELVIGRAGPAAVDQARSITNDWSTTLRLSAAPGQADVLESATGADAVSAYRAAVDDAATGERSGAATEAWNRAHGPTAEIIAGADAEIWANLVAQRDAARREARLTPLFVAAGALVALLGLVWVARRWPLPTAIDPDEVSLETLVSVEPSQGADDAPTDEVDAEAPSPDAEPDLEPIFAAPSAGPARPSEPTRDGELFTEAEPATEGDRPIPSGQDVAVSDLVAGASAGCLRASDVVVETVDDGVVAASVAADLHDMIVTLLDSALAHGKPDVPVRVIGSAHELGYLIWVVDDGDGLDADRRVVLNNALGGRLDDDGRSKLLVRLAAVGEQAGLTGIDIELLADEEDGNLARLFVPARHLADAPTEREAPAAVGETETTVRWPDPLAAVTTERLSARLARRAHPTAPKPGRPGSASAIDRSPPARPSPARRPDADGDPAWPSSTAKPVGLGDAAPALSDAERRAEVARRLVEQYRGAVGAALMDGADDTAMSLPPRSPS